MTAVKPSDGLLVGVCFVVVSILLLLVVFFNLPPGSKEFWPSIVIALIPAICGVDEITRCLYERKHKNTAAVETKMQINSNKSLPKSHFWIYGVIPIIIGMGMVLLPKFIPPPSQKSGELIIVVALIPIIYGIAEIMNYLLKYLKK